MNQTKNSTIGLVLGMAILGLQTGCVGYVDGPRAAVYAPQPSVYVEPGVAVQDDYVYYPDYQVYYSSGRRQFVYLDGGSWVSRSAPPHVSVGVFFASASVKVGFHDSPANHHAEISRQYPRHAASPPNRSKQDPRNNHEDHRDDDKGRN